MAKPLKPRFVSCLGAALLVICLFGVSYLPAKAQLLPGNSGVPPTATQAPSSEAPSPAPSPTPSAAERLLPSQLSSEWVMPEAVDTAPIYLDGRTLFLISAPAVDQQRPAESRAQEIQQRLYEIASKTFAANDPPPTVSIKVDEASNLPVISVNDTSLLTVTLLDAQISGHANPITYADILQTDLERAFRRYWQERQPKFWQQQAKVAAVIVVIALLLQLWAIRASRVLRLRQIRLRSANTQMGPHREPNSMVEASPMLAEPPYWDGIFDQLKARLDNRQKRKLNETADGLLILFQLGLWLGSLLWILNLSPYSRWLTTLLLYWTRVPTKILLIGIIAYIAIRLSSVLIDKVGLALQEGARWAPARSRRLDLRFSTFSQAAKGVAGAVIFGIAVLSGLAIAGVKIAPLLAGAGIAGIGISLAAQSLIKDIINGFLILFEDHFGIGDVISVQGLTGSVEYVNLRITQLRDSEGRVITIPNSQISIVQNLSKDWAQVDLSIVIDHTADVNKAIALLKSTALELSQEEAWQRLILEPPDVLGIEAVNPTGITLRLLLKTQPLQQWPVARELRARIKHQFDAAEIAIGVPQEKVELHWQSGLDSERTPLG